jgi:hypothetical protein
MPIRQRSNGVGHSTARDRPALAACRFAVSRLRTPSVSQKLIPDASIDQAGYGECSRTETASTSWWAV